MNLAGRKFQEHAQAVEEALARLEEVGVQRQDLLGVIGAAELHGQLAIAYATLYAAELAGGAEF